MKSPKACFMVVYGAVAFTRTNSSASAIFDVMAEIIVE
jgi:hypothetical protein